MKKIALTILLIIFVTIFIPLIIICNISGFYSPEKIGNNSGDANYTSPTNAKEYPQKISVYINKEDKVVEMETSDYLKGVLAAEMPVSFNKEALKAQAVAARSYLLSHITSYKANGAPEEHKGADTCTNYAHCQAWITVEDRKASWRPEEADANWAKICEAVDSTTGVIMTYNGGVVNAIFHSTSSGKTEKASDVWGSDVPYLQSVASVGDNQSPKYSSDVSITIDEFKKIAQDNIKDVNWDNGLIGDINRSEAGGIISIIIGGQSVKGTTFRTIFNLRSTNAEITQDSDKINISVKGYGHGVGMSQYGANYLAGQGKSYEEILKTYYSGIQLGNSKDLSL